MSLGLFLIALSVVLLELVVSRLFSASTGYHLAFMIVSITMFGMTLGALAVLMAIPKDKKSVFRYLKLSSSCFGIAVALALLAQQSINKMMETLGVFSWITVTFITFSVCFFFAGVCISLCLSRFKSISKLYAFDLLGAAISCPLLVVGLSLTSGQAVMLLCGVIAGLSSLAFSFAENNSSTVSKVLFPLVTVLFCGAMIFAPLPEFKKVTNLPVEFVKWSPLGRVVVTEASTETFTWGKDKEQQEKILQKALFIDSGAMTVITKYDDNPDKMMPLRKDLTAVGNELRPEGNLFVIGAGGGRDIITGILFKQKEIDAIEVNPAIVEMIKGRYANFVGRIHEKSGVSIINNEAREWLAKSGKKYSLIQCSLVDTWAASSSGAFMLTENILYTAEAFETFVKHLKPKGVFSVIRWGDEKRPAEVLKIATLAKVALKKSGIEGAKDKIMLISAPSTFDASLTLLLVSPNNFSDQDIEKMKQICSDRGYKILWLPNGEGLEPFVSFMKDSQALSENIPTDDKPFFFTSFGHHQANNEGVGLLVFTLLLSFILVVFTILVPLFLKVGKNLEKRILISSATFFTLLGLGFMLVEVGLIQRLTILLGSPTYGLTVVLFALLLASGLGSYFVQWRLDNGQSSNYLIKTGLLASAILSLTTCFASLWSMQLMASASTEIKILLAVLLVALPGFFMGWCFPLGMKIFEKGDSTYGAWFWGVNGATTVLGSVLAAIVSVLFGITYTISCGSLIYLLALLVLLWQFRSQEKTA